MNYFENFDLLPTFAIDQKGLASRFREIQSTTHPDRFASASDAEKRVAMEKATEVNDAYQTLRDPVRRAMYLLWLKNVNGMDEKNTSMPHDFLVEQIEWREAIADAKLKEDTDRLDEMNTELQSIMDSLGSTFSAAYEGNHLPTATTLARKMRFMQKLIEEVDLAIAAVDG
ncbi:MAG: Fe-S protein assembly co-chaperone HscB [Casimicrobium sp.]